MKKDRALPPRVFDKGKWYYLVTAEGAKRVWKKLTPIRDGLPALYLKLAEIHAQDVAPDKVPLLVAEWLRDVSEAEHKPSTQVNDRWLMGIISTDLAEFRAADVTPPDVAVFLKPWRDKKRTHNALRSALRDLMRYAEERGYRPAGSNPVTAIKGMKTKPRTVYITDSQLRRIKVAACYGNDGLRTRSGPMLCEILNLAYLTGQRASDVIDLRWSQQAATDAAGQVVAPYVGKEGLHFKPSKTAGSTGAKVLIEWTPRLEQVVARIKAIGRRHLSHVITTQDAQPYSYWGVNSAWKRALKRAGIAGIHLHDLRAKAITDKDDKEGLQAAKSMGAHSTERQTADYVRHRKARKTKATR